MSAGGYEHLREYSDWVDVVRRRRRLFPVAEPGARTQAQVRESLGLDPGPKAPAEIRTGRRWEADGVEGEEVSWSVGYGPRTHAWVLRPAGVTGPLPGIVALHDHSGFKFYGKEKIADGPAGPLPAVADLRSGEYDGRAFANLLAGQGFTVLVHDTFLWGSRRFDLATMPDRISGPTAGAAPGPDRADGVPPEIARYNAAAGHHEHLVEKYCRLLGTTLAGVVCFEDQVAVNYLRGRRDISTDRIGCVGLSGGGCRAALLQATCHQIRASVVVGMMSTYPALLDRHVATHTWMFFPRDWAAHGDWPDLAACRAPSPLLVQYNRDDPLFPPVGMNDAHQRITDHYRNTGSPDAYRGEFYDGPHKFDSPMQQAAFGWLTEHLA